MSEAANPIRLSALVVAHNEEEILAECLKRLAFADELVVVLDRCTDGSKAIADEYADSVLVGAWELEGDRRNLGIRTCRGAWIIEADADEWINEKLATEIWETIEKHNFQMKENSFLTKNRKEQNIYWLHSQIKEELGNKKYSQLETSGVLKRLEEKLLDKKATIYQLLEDLNL